MTGTLVFEGLLPLLRAGLPEAHAKACRFSGIDLEALRAAGLPRQPSAEEVLDAMRAAGLPEPPLVVDVRENCAVDLVHGDAHAVTGLFKGRYRTPCGRRFRRGSPAWWVTTRYVCPAGYFLRSGVLDCAGCLALRCYICHLPPGYSGWCEKHALCGGPRPYELPVRAYVVFERAGFSLAEAFHAADAGMLPAIDAQVARDILARFEPTTRPSAEELSTLIREAAAGLAAQAQAFRYDRARSRDRREVGAAKGAT